MIKLEEIHRKLAILPLHWDQPSLGPQRAGGRQRINSGIVESDDGYLPAEDPGPSITHVVAILPDFDGFLTIYQNSTICKDITVARLHKTPN